MSRHIARRAFALARSTCATALASSSSSSSAASTSTSRAALGSLGSFASPRAALAASPARAFASGLTIDGGVSPAVDAVLESVVVVPEASRPTIPATGLEIEPKGVFGVVEVRTHQFKVSPDDLIYVDKIKGVGVNDVVSLPRVLMLGNKTTTVIGRPTVPGAEVVALVEEQVRDGKKIIFKKKRRKNYRRSKGFRAQLTGLRVLEVRGIDE